MTTSNQTITSQSQKHFQWPQSNLRKHIQWSYHPKKITTVKSQSRLASSQEHYLQTNLCRFTLFISSRIDYRHVLRDIPRFLVPCRFQASFAIESFPLRKFYQIQNHFRHFISCWSRLSCKSYILHLFNEDLKNTDKTLIINNLNFIYH